jgi:carbohydrate kinase (thermoresistant glucokinase family)
MDQHAAHNRPMIVVVMGVAGSGKTTVATRLAAKLGWAYQEGDALHPPQNVEKMKGGTPLTDADRLPWLRRIAERIDDWRAHGQSGVVTCSALKRSYRDILIGDRREVVLVYLTGSPELIRKRLAERRGHFMPPELLDSQLATLQEPSADERPVVASISGTPDEIAEKIDDRLGAIRLRPAPDGTDEPGRHTRPGALRGGSKSASRGRERRRR